MANPRRNDPCPCGSAKKYKHCCLAKDREKQNIEREPSSELVQRVLGEDRDEAGETHAKDDSRAL